MDIQQKAWSIPQQLSPRKEKKNPNQVITRPIFSINHKFTQTQQYIMPGHLPFSPSL